MNKITTFLVRLCAIALLAAALPALAADPDSAAGRDTLVPLASILQEKGFNCVWIDSLGILRCTQRSDTLRFFRDLAFYRVNDSILQLPLVPEYKDSSLCIPVQLTDELRNVVLRVNAKAVADTVRSVVKPPAPSKPLAADSTPAVQADSRPIAKTIDSSGRATRGPVIKTIVIDPGHGGQDPGAVGPGDVYEKDIVLAISLNLRDYFKKKTNLAIFLTRDKDVFVPLQRRTKFANEKKADLFISIHANSIAGEKKRREAKGFKIFFLSQAKSEGDRLTEMKENSVINLETEAEKGDLLQSILVHMVGNEYLSESQDLAIKVAESYKSAVREIDKVEYGVGQANFWVLHGSFMPSILVETGFISHPNEEKLLSDPITQDKIAFALFSAVMSFKKKYEQ